MNGDVETWRHYRMLAQAGREIEISGDSIQLCAHRVIQCTDDDIGMTYCAGCNLTFLIGETDIVVRFFHEDMPAHLLPLWIRVPREAGLDWLRDMEVEMAT